MAKLTTKDKALIIRAMQVLGIQETIHQLQHDPSTCANCRQQTIEDYHDRSNPENKLIYRPGFDEEIGPGSPCAVGGRVIRRISQAEYMQRHGVSSFEDLINMAEAKGYFEIDLDQKPDYGLHEKKPGASANGAGGDE